MKLKLKQKVQLGYHVVKLKVLAATAPKLAAEAAFKLFCTPYSGKPKRKAPAIFHRAEKRKLTIDGIQVNGFYWKATGESARTVLICHGFDSCCYKFEKYVHDLLDHNLNVLAFDAPAHGISEGNQVHALLYGNTIAAIAKEFGPLHGIMGHSFGGLAALLAAEKLQQPHIKIVAIAPATETATAIDFFFKLLKMDGVLIDELGALIERIGHKPVSWYSANRTVQAIQNEVLWIHDKHDKICPFADTTPIREQQPAHLTFIATEQLGHNRIYRDKEVQKKVVEFFACC